MSQHRVGTPPPGSRSPSPVPVQPPQDGITSVQAAHLTAGPDVHGPALTLLVGSGNHLAETNPTATSLTSSLIVHQAVPPSSPRLEPKPLLSDVPSSSTVSGREARSPSQVDTPLTLTPPVPAPVVHPVLHKASEPMAADVKKKLTYNACSVVGLIGTALGALVGAIFGAIYGAVVGKTKEAAGECAKYFAGVFASIAGYFTGGAIVDGIASLSSKISAKVAEAKARKAAAAS